jgi:hypothetical protein
MINPSDWYWIVSGDATKVYSSKRNVYVPASDADYQAWLVAQGGTSRIGSEAEILYYIGDSLPTWLNTASGFVQPAVGAYTKAQLKAYAGNVRYNKEVGGTTVSGVAYPTDRETQSKMTAAVVLSQVNPSATFKWKLPDGSFTASLNAAGMLAVASAVGAFVQTCFETEASVVAAIDAGTITTISGIDAAFA